MKDPLINSPEVYQRLKKNAQGTGRVAWNALPINILRKKAGVKPMYSRKK